MGSFCVRASRERLLRTRSTTSDLNLITPRVKKRGITFVIDPEALG